jgi:hypothetical protein
MTFNYPLFFFVHGLEDHDSFSMPLQYCDPPQVIASHMN